jgi:hypothetical protein
MRVVNGAALFCFIWTHAATVQAPPSDHGSHTADGRGTTESCAEVEPPKKVEPPKPLFIGVCPAN